MCSEIGLTALHGLLFAYLTDEPNLSEEHFFAYAQIFAIVLLVIVSLNLVFLAIDCYIPLLRFAVLFKIIDESVLKNAEKQRFIDEFSASDDSMTERDMSINSKELGKYGPDYNEDKIEYVDPKAEERKARMKLKKKKAPKKEEDPLVSNFGPKYIPLAKIEEPEKTEGEGEGDDDSPKLSQNAGNRTAIQNLPGQLTPLQEDKIKTAKIGPGGFGTQPLQPIEEEKRLDESRLSKSPHSSKGGTPKEGEEKEANLLTPALSQPTGFAGGEFGKALEKAKSQTDYNFLPYKK